ncbi:MAG: peptidylprolyl isomerase [Candidatus Nanohaloarchaeota archaeon]|nr:peptidylprolyl isomerase [Candidatus Nanohaloarchaeota archaeon]
MAAVQKGDVILIEYAGYLADNNELFDTNIEEVAKKHNKHDKEAKYHPMAIVVGERHVIKGLDDDFIGKEIGKEYTITIQPEDAFGKRDPSLIKTVSMSEFKKQNFTPQPGMILTFSSGAQVKILSVSAGRVKLDYNHPLAGKVVRYTYRIVKKLDDPKDKLIGLAKTLAFLDLEGKVKKEGNTLIVDKSLESLKDVLEKIVKDYIPNVKLEFADLSTKSTKSNSKTKNVQKSK